LQLCTGFSSKRPLPPFYQNYDWVDAPQRTRKRTAREQWSGDAMIDDSHLENRQYQARWNLQDCVRPMNRKTRRIESQKKCNRYFNRIYRWGGSWL
jgi:hypothetical protein